MNLPNLRTVDPELLIVAVLASLVLAAVVFLLRRPEDKALDATPEAVPLAPEPPVEVDEPAAELPPARIGASFFEGLRRSRERLSQSLLGLDPKDEEALEGLEEALISADVGVRTATELVDHLRGGQGDPRALLTQKLLGDLGQSQGLNPVQDATPHVILVVGVNGSGKTTTIGKLAARFMRDGKSVVLGAGDTFRAGAIEQLKVWGERTGAPVIAQQEGSDPAAVAFDAVKAGVARHADVVICDTAGRLQSQKPLMDELGKVLRSIGKALPGAPHEVLLVLDATIGQNALSQAQTFKDTVGVTGVVLTKLDGTAKGGVVVAVQKDLGLPVKLVGLGEGADDLRDFDPSAFVAALVGPDEALAAS